MTSQFDNDLLDVAATVPDAQTPVTVIRFCIQQQRARFGGDICCDFVGRFHLAS